MAHRNKVARSLDSPCGTRCVDIHRSPDGAYGFTEYRRDPEDNSGWHPTGLESVETFSSLEAALDAARAGVAWLAEVSETDMTRRS